jgi:PIN domain nuclease of toxin-antitoxin system
MAKKSSSDSSHLLLDTHILLWLASGDEQLNQSSIDIIEKAAQRQELRLSVISLWEIGYLIKKGRINLSNDIKTYWQQTLKRLFAQDLAINADDIVQYHKLPENFHGDPGDRFLVSQAITRRMRLMTADTKIIPFAAQLAPAKILAANASRESY